MTQQTTSAAKAFNGDIQHLTLQPHRCASGVRLPGTPHRDTASRCAQNGASTAPSALADRRHGPGLRALARSSGLASSWPYRPAQQHVAPGAIQFVERCNYIGVGAVADWEPPQTPVSRRTTRAQAHKCAARSFGPTPLTIFRQNQFRVIAGAVACTYSHNSDPIGLGSIVRIAAGRILHATQEHDRFYWHRLHRTRTQLAPQGILRRRSNKATHTLQNRTPAAIKWGNLAPLSRWSRSDGRPQSNKSSRDAAVMAL